MVSIATIILTAYILMIGALKPFWVLMISKKTTQITTKEKKLQIQALRLSINASFSTSILL